MIHHKLCPVCGFDAYRPHDCNAVLQRKEDFIKAKMSDSAIAKQNAEAARRLAALEQAMGEVDGLWFTNQKDLLIWLQHRADEIMRGGE